MDESRSAPRQPDDGRRPRVATWIRRGLAGTAVLALIAAVLILSASARPPTDDVGVYVMGDTGAYLEVCGCDAGLLGGYNRVASYLREHHGAPGGDTPPWVLLDSGNFLVDDGDLARMRARYALEILGLLRPAAINLGVRDLVFGAAMLADVRTPLPYVAAGVGAGGLERGALTPPAWRLVDADGLKIGVIGIGVGDGGEPVPASTANERVAAAAKEARAAGAKTLVLLADLEPLVAREVAVAAGGVQAIVLSAGTRSEEPRVGAGGPIISPGEKAHHLGRMLFDRTTGELTGVEWVPMDVELDLIRADDVLELVKSFRGESKKLGVANKEERTRLANEGLENPYVGSLACKECHGGYDERTQQDEPYDRWLDQENHFKAYRIFTDLEPNEAMRSVPTPDCVICHVVGFRKLQPDPEAPPKFVWFEEGVACEVCHGPGNEHVASDGARGTIIRGSVETAREEICVKCHVPDHSPKFDYLKYLRRIRHWPLEKEDRLRSGEIPVPSGPPEAVPGVTLGLGNGTMGKKK